MSVREYSARANKSYVSDHMAKSFYSPPKDELSSRNIQLCTLCLSEMWAEGNTLRANSCGVRSEKIPKILPSILQHQKWTKEMSHVPFFLNHTCHGNSTSWTKCSHLSKMNMCRAPCKNLVMIKDRPPTCALWVDNNIVFTWKSDVGRCNPSWTCPFRIQLRVSPSLNTLW